MDSLKKYECTKCKTQSLIRTDHYDIISGLCKQCTLKRPLISTKHKCLEKKPKDYKLKDSKELYIGTINDIQT